MEIENTMVIEIITGKKRKKEKFLYCAPAALLATEPLISLKWPSF